MYESSASESHERLPLEDFKRRFVKHITKSTSRQVVYGMPVFLYAERAAHDYWEAAEQGCSPEEYAQDDMEFWHTDNASIK